MNGTMNSVLAIVLGAVVFVGLTASAQEKKTSAKSESPATSMPKPGPELDALKWFAGTWGCSGTSPAGAMGPGSPAMKYQATLKVKPVLGGFWYLMEYEQKKSKTHPMEFKGAYHAGWDAGEKKLLFLWTDATGGWARETSMGWEGDKMVLTGDQGVALGQPSSFRDTLTKKGDKGLHWKGELKGPGSPDFNVFGEDDCKKL